MEEIKVNIEDIFGERKKRYNDIPVAFCSRCLSLKIRKTEDNEDYCDDCGETKIRYGSIDAWTDLVKEEKGNNFVIQNKYGR